LENSFKQTHYERIALADDKYGTEVPGWKTDRGRVYITFGPPDSIESHRAGEKNAKAAEDGVETFPYPWEGWHYSHLEGIEENVEIGFVDKDSSGNYRLTLSPEAKDAAIITPPDYLAPSARLGPRPGLAPTPRVQFKDLEAIVTTQVVRDQVRFSHRIEFAKATNATTLVRILLRLPSQQLSSLSNNRDSSTEFEVFGRISKPSGWVVETFERKISLDGRGNSVEHQPNCRFNVAISPGTYQMSIVAKNMVTGETGVLHTAIEVPSYEELSLKK
jgi:GWxTD domain-containing protein